MNNTLVSIIIPIYNAEKYITETLYSLINQSYKNLEIICVNDGSPDNSSEIIIYKKNETSPISFLFLPGTYCRY